jgi:hypothetical protein
MSCEKKVVKEANRNEVSARFIMFRHLALEKKKTIPNSVLL